MRTHGSLKILPLAVLVVSLAVSAVFALCRTGQSGYQYWDEVRETCRNCSSCTEPGHIVLRPCQVYQDTICGPLHALNIDWSWLGHRPHHKKQDQWIVSNHSYQRQWPRGNGNKSHNLHQHHFKFHHHHKKIRPPESAAQLKTMSFDESKNTVLQTPISSLPLAAQATLQHAPAFTKTEALVWDWQVGVLALAVFACILFFGAAAGYGVRQVRHDAYRTADVEDLSAALSLMIPGVNSDAIESNSSSIEACNTKQCLYMEKLLVCKQPDGHGNVYINRVNTGM